MLDPDDREGGCRGLLFDWADLKAAVAGQLRTELCGSVMAESRAKGLVCLLVMNQIRTTKAGGTSLGEKRVCVVPSPHRLTLPGNAEE